MGHRDLLVTRTYLRQTPNARVCPREASAGRLSSSGVIGNLADLGAVLLRLDDGPLRKQAPYGHRQLPILPDSAALSTRGPTQPTVVRSSKPPLDHGRISVP